jgi:hypothetical protein
MNSRLLHLAVPICRSSHPGRCWKLRPSGRVCVLRTCYSGVCLRELLCHSGLVHCHLARATFWARRLEAVAENVRCHIQKTYAEKGYARADPFSFSPPKSKACSFSLGACNSVWLHPRSSPALRRDLRLEYVQQPGRHRKPHDHYTRKVRRSSYQNCHH